MDEKLLAAFISAGVGLAGIAITAVFSWKSYALNKAKEVADREAATRKERLEREAERRKVIVTALTEFYGPFLYYLDETRALYEPFRKGKPKEFRTLTYLLEPTQLYDTPEGRVTVSLSDSDRALMRRIIATEDKIEELIRLKGGLVDDPILLLKYEPSAMVTDVPKERIQEMGLLGLALAHFRVLKLAFEGEIKGDAQKYAHLVYPRELDAKIKEKTQQLQTELRQLIAASAAR